LSISGNVPKRQFEIKELISNPVWEHCWQHCTAAVASEARPLYFFARNRIRPICRKEKAVISVRRARSGPPEPDLGLRNQIWDSGTRSGVDGHIMRDRSSLSAPVSFIVQFVGRDFHQGRTAGAAPPLRRCALNTVIRSD